MKGGVFIVLCELYYTYVVKIHDPCPADADQGPGSGVYRLEWGLENNLKQNAMTIVIIHAQFHCQMTSFLSHPVALR